MSEFMIECPSCGRYAQGKTGFFARKRIDCVCGHVIDVRTEKLTSTKCPHCGNTVVYDQTKQEPVCPVCREPINPMQAGNAVAEFTCGQCGITLHADRGVESFICPVCDCVNDVQARLAAQDARQDGLISVIKYEGDNDTLVWKHPIEDFNLGSQLIVHESQEAIFFRDGQALDLFGPGCYTLETQQLPLLEKLYTLPTNGVNTFHSEVYYINLTTQMGIKWGTDSKVRLFDPQSGLHVELGASGEFNIRVINSRKLLLKLVGTTGSLTQDMLLGSPNGKGLFRSLVMTQVKAFLAQTIRAENISVLEIDEHLMTLSGALRQRINEKLQDYGLEMPEFFVARIVTPDDDPNFRRMKEQYAEQYLLVRQEQIRKSEAEAVQARKAVEAQTAAQLKIIGAQGEAEALRIRKQAEADAYRMQAEAEAVEMKMKGYTYQQETARQVGMEAMQNGLTGVDGGSGLLGGVAGLGVTLGAMGGVVGMTKEAISPVMESIRTAAAPADGWSCTCGKSGITSRFCPECGSPKPEPKAGWDCPSCGAKGITSRFCPECGAKKPENLIWDCPDCGTRGITSKFCPECGRPRPEARQTWNCPNCGNRDITAKFCPECGTKKGE